MIIYNLNEGNIALDDFSINTRLLVECINHCAMSDEFVLFSTVTLLNILINKYNRWIYSRHGYADDHIGQLHVVSLQLVLDVHVAATARLVRPAVYCAREKKKTKYFWV